MSLIAIKDVSLTRVETLFTGLSFSIAKGDRLGLVAANGRGKSSLLRILAGEDDATTGTVTRRRGLIVAAAPQDPPERLLSLSFHEAVRDALAPDVAEIESWRVDVLLDDLLVDDSIRGRAIRRLSGGWQRTMLLARAAVVEPDLLLLDEPTNHLDIGRIGVLERFLAALPRDCAVVAASHDRAFLDDVTSRTLFLRPEDSADFSLPYSHAVQALEERDAARERQFENDMRKVKSLRQQAAKLKNIGINSGSDLLVVKTKQLSERADQLEERARPAHLERSAGTIRLTNSGSHAKALVTINNTAITTPDGRVLFRIGPSWIENGDRVALLGANGTGKTRLVERLRAALTASDPDIRGATSLKLGYSDQALSQLDAFATPWEAVKRLSSLPDQLTRSQLAGAGVGIDAQAAPISRLSGGQRARLAMLLLRLAQPNFYLLDEPTNHLDINGQDMLESELIAHGAACLLVSHDRAFVRAVATRIWVISEKRLVEVDDPAPVFDRLMSG
ncbi:ABC-F family ATP-binding cassette domain-containing protein [Bradyrhizobium sp. INPA01-394B]|uniref:ABC-F family ATP-binding cassette domain-containing protein n=1 Tax=Bradyrhizobium campsiandrae TaxID=1729892 RepID=A0ABR7UFF3_9BRAD|nr:ABC-F family ATP-binding cassette domain-containing protein [Bradyrhizobium campsiandrae]MBC9882695.1 ABC-F family ATP-binding cassette domain-containing protein [Bradyrhizobium campsiandrae]MBC9982684.1 ABC-F family ATP-binding cassette domain-containing protein [Bradyrhizobium campsiandrae]